MERKNFTKVKERTIIALLKRNLLDLIMKLLVRENELFSYYTEIFKTREEAKSNVDESRDEFVGRAFKSIEGMDGFTVAVSSNELKEFYRVPKIVEIKEVEKNEINSCEKPKLTKEEKNTTRRIKVEFTKNIHLPRFNMAKGDKWEVRVDRMQKEGFSLGGGFVENNEYKVVGWE